jgi:carbon-monoxide dehydrogenase large subunit
VNDGIGAALRRREDGPLLLGRGRFVADLDAPHALHVAFVRSPHAHARIERIDSALALALPGVVAVRTGTDLARAGVQPMRALWSLQTPDGPMREPPRRALALDRVRFVGEAVAMVLAESRLAALDAAEAVAVDYQPLPAVADTRDAVRADAPLVHDDVPGNACLRWRRGDPRAVQEAFARAAHVTRIALVNQRLAGCAIEPRAALAQPDGDGLLVHSSTQVPHHVRQLLAEELGLAQSAIRVVAPDVGGGFGYKGKHYPEELACAWAALTLQRAVRWTATRSESFVADLTSRDHDTEAELALDRDGTFLALRVRTLASLGAYVSSVGAGIPTAIHTSLLAGVYRTPAIEIDVTGVFTHTQPTDAYRGAGRPEACYVLERLADRAARELGLDRAEIRRRNLIPREAMPYTTPIGPTYDSGDFPRVFERALAAADYASFAARREAAEKRGLRRGIGVAVFVESSGVAPSRLVGALGVRAGFFESCEIRVDGSGSIVAALGTHNHGQGHATTFAQVLATRLGVPASRVRIVEGDTAAVPLGTGTFGSRSMAVGGSALDRACLKIVAKGTRVAAHLLEAAETDVSFARGEFRVAGTDRAVSFETVASVANRAHVLPPDIEPGLHESAFYDPSNFAYSNGAHVCEVEIDPDTGVVRIVRYVTVDDVGTVINPMIVHGQVHGGLAQGLGQALLERMAYARDSAQVLSGTFMDYALPRAADLPDFHCETDESQPCTHNPLGVKGCGESGAIGAPPALVSAVLDATGADDIEMPCTPERVWRALAAARRA